MRLPRVRFTVRRMMVAVAIVGTIFAVAAHLHRQDRTKAIHLIGLHRYRAKDSRLESARLLRLAGSESNPRKAVIWKYEAALYVKSAKTHEERAETIRRLYGFKPWPSFVPDPPEPK